MMLYPDVNARRQLCSLGLAICLMTWVQESLPVVAAPHAGSPATVGSPAVVAPAVTIGRQPMQARWQETKEMRPRLRSGDGGVYSGITEWFYHCRPQVTADVVSVDTSAQGAVLAKVRVTAVAMVLSLSVETKCAPRPNTREHERGHVEICRRIYDKFAESAAQAGCLAVIGQTFTGKGNSKSAAVQAARREAALTICRHYRAKTAQLADIAARAYDKVTMHGRSKKVSSKSGVEEALKRAGAASI